jgi:hypothetical protein
MQVPDPSPLQPSIEAIVQSIRSEALKSKNDTTELLSLLRVLEDLHRKIRDDYFLKALPDNRQALYSLLRNIEQNGGWPYIPRIKLKKFLAELENSQEL